MPIRGVGLHDLRRRALRAGVLGGRSPQFTDVPEAESFALEDLYTATSGDSWSDNTGWDGDTAGDAYGVTVSGGHVTEIDLSINNLNGEWTTALLTPFTALVELQAYFNGSLNCSFALSDLPSGMTHLYLFDTSSEITGALSDLPSGMTYLNLYNTSTEITGALSDLPSGMTHLNLGITDSTITGALSDLPSGMTYLNLYNTSSEITGALSDLPSGMTYLNLGGTSSTITGGASAMAATGIRLIRTDDCGEDQATVNDVIGRIHADRASFTYATPELNIGGDNATPSGTYQSVCPPTTALEEVHNLANDGCSDGHNTWTITWNGGSAP